MLTYQIVTIPVSTQTPSCHSTVAAVERCLITSRGVVHAPATQWRPHTTTTRMTAAIHITRIGVDVC